MARARLHILWQMILAPWPASLGWFAAMATLGGLAPFVQIWATTRLIDALAARPAAIPASSQALWPTLAAYLPWIAAFAGAWIVGFIVSMNIVQPYIAAYHAERIVERWLPRVLEKSQRLRLEQFERPAYFDQLQRARAALQADPIALQHSQFQRILARTGGCVGIVAALAGVHWLLAVALLTTSVAITHWRLRRSRTMVAAQRAQTPLQRRRDYWRDLLTQRGIRFRNIQFVYPGSRRPALEGIDLHIHPGERIALVGENGAGKSTFARLLLGLYRPTVGQILVEGVDLQSIDPAAWRAQAAAVFQDHMRYTGTARENIGYGAVERLDDDAAIAAAARKSGAGAVVAQLPHGYATMLGKEFAGGIDLSGGQWQTFAIARAYLRDAAVLVLDEPAAALDARAEVEVYRQFRDVAEGRSVLLISHRLGSARLADRILVLAGGRISETGTHAELLVRAGHYATLYRVQAAWYQ